MIMNLSESKWQEYYSRKAELSEQLNAFFLFSEYGLSSCIADYPRCKTFIEKNRDRTFEEIRLVMEYEMESLWDRYFNPYLDQDGAPLDGREPEAFSWARAHEL